jgi:hypothetical protein
MTMQGRMDESARARRQLRIYANKKPVTNADKKLTTNATFSEMPCCTKSSARVDVSTLDAPVEVRGEQLTSIGLYARGDFASAHIIEENDVLTKHGSQICLTQTSCGNLGSIDPYIHINVCAYQHADAWAPAAISVRLP